MDYFIYDERLEITRKMEFEEGSFHMGREFVEETQRIASYDVQNKRYSSERESRISKRLVEEKRSLHRKMVSREHCRFNYSEEGLEITDMNSRNGTYVDHRRVLPGEHPVVPLEFSLLLGELKLRVYEGDESIEFRRYEPKMDDI